MATISPPLMSLPLRRDASQTLGFVRTETLASALYTYMIEWLCLYARWSVSPSLSSMDGWVAGSVGALAYFGGLVFAETLAGWLAGWRAGAQELNFNLNLSQVR
jgi:hypothetical protein